MFWRKTKAAIAEFHPLHQKLIWEHTLSATLPTSEWSALVASLSRHNEAVHRRKWRLPARTETVLVPLIRVLCEDVGPDGALGINADLRGHSVPGKAGPQQQLPAQRPIRKLVQWWVQDPWLRVRSQLRDGSVLEFGVVDVVRHRRVSKTSRSGKYKTKSKTKAVQRIFTTRALAKGQPAAQPAGAPPPWIRVKVKPGPKTVIRASAKVPLPAERDQLGAIMTVATELFRWTGPTRRTA